MGVRTQGIFWPLPVGTITGPFPVPFQFNLAGILTTGPLPSDQNDYNPAGLSTSSILRIDPGASSHNITGIAAQPAGTVLIIENVSGANNITLVNSSGSSQPANQFLLSSNIVIGPAQSALLIYDAVNTRWRSIGAGVASISAGLYMSFPTITSIGTVGVHTSLLTSVHSLCGGL